MSEKLTLAPTSDDATGESRVLAAAFLVAEMGDIDIARNPLSPQQILVEVDHLDRTGSETYLVHVGEQLVAVVSLIDMLDHLFIGDVAVLGSERGKHVGTKVMYLLAEETQRRNYERMTIWSRDDDSTAFYTKLGFVATAENLETHNMTIDAQRLLDRRDSARGAAISG